MALIKRRFFDKYGNFDNTRFLELLKKAQREEVRSRYGSKAGTKDIVLFASVSRKDLWQFINKFSIFINSGIDIKGAL